MSASIREQIIGAVRDRLAAITEAAGYSRTVLPDNVTDYLQMTEDCPTPACGVHDAQETINPKTTNGRYERTLRFSIVFVDEYAADEPGAEARSFLADIQKAMRRDLALTVALASPAVGTGAITVQLAERASLLNGGPPLDGRIYGQVDYWATYFTNDRDPGAH